MVETGPTGWTYTGPVPVAVGVAVSAGPVVDGGRFCDFCRRNGTAGGQGLLFEWTEFISPTFS